MTALSNISTIDQGCHSETSIIASDMPEITRRVSNTDFFGPYSVASKSAPEQFMAREAKI